MSRITRSKEVRSYASASRPDVRYTVLAVLDDDNHVYLSCNCPAWTRGREQRGKQAWERTCKHTDLVRKFIPGWEWYALSPDEEPKPKSRPARASRAPAKPKTEKPDEVSRFDLLEL